MMKPQAANVGYSILRIGSGEDLEVCIVAPHLRQPAGLQLDFSTRRLHVLAGEASMSLPDLPLDVARLLAVAPSQVLFVTTDCLSGIRFSASADELMTSSH